MTSPTTVEDGSGVHASLEHIGLLYDTEAAYLDGVLSFVHAALSAGDPVLVAVPGGNLDLVRSALGADAERVRLADMAVAGRNPGRILPAVLCAFADEHAGRRVSIVGEPIWAGRDELEYPACLAHEALINAVLAERDVAVLCPYDTRGLDARAVADAHRTHPVMEHLGVRSGSTAYTDPIALAAECNGPLPAPPPGAATAAYAVPTDLPLMRRFTTVHASAAGLDPDRAEELVVAVNELVANTLEHTGGGGTVTAWSQGGAFVCQVEDTGHLADPLAGRVPPPVSATGGRGLIFIQRLCDLVRVETRPGRTVIRLFMDV
jgi:anti-sigma regulatory factor (Ser/Thr protein kinase)